jgi:hypothetical protein
MKRVPKEWYLGQATRCDICKIVADVIKEEPTKLCADSYE